MPIMVGSSVKEIEVLFLHAETRPLGVRWAGRRVEKQSLLGKATLVLGIPSVAFEVSYTKRPLLDNADTRLFRFTVNNHVG